MNHERLPPQAPKTPEELEWLGHVETDQLKREVIQRLGKYLEMLIKTAEGSHDADVRAAAVKYRESQRELRRLVDGREAPPRNVVPDGKSGL